ncbi:MAG: 3D domain-containing protein [Bacteroidales bacterium]|nr:3D domain-containing protein [Clostridium sp.]MCM1202948.1 3D domain-containing protein [Bacteroidales bacterium]
MKKRIEIKTVIGIIGLVLFTALVFVFGYRVIVTAGELPGKLSSVPTAAANVNVVNYSLKRVQKVSFDTMRYGYMDDLMLAQMNNLDSYYEKERLEEIRAVNNLTAMQDKTSDRLAYEEAKAKREEEEKKAKEAVRIAEAAKEAKARQIAEQIRNEENGVNLIQNIDTGGSGNLGFGDTASRGGQIGEPVYAAAYGQSLGTFVITAYCTCRVCCGVYSGGNRTASGTVPTTNRTIAVDTNVIPFGTRLIINGQVYVAEDRGGDIQGKRIDVFFYTHQEALRWGRRAMEVFLAE